MEQWLTDLLQQHINDEGTFDTDGFGSAYDAEAPKHSVPKAVFNEKNDELKEAKQTLEQLESTDNSEDLKAELEKYQSRLKEVETERQEERKQQALIKALDDAVDPDFVADLIKGEVELNDKGELEGLDELLSARKEKQPYLFKQAKEEKKEEQTEKVDNEKLPKQQSTPLTKEDIMKVKDKGKRLELIGDNPELFGK